MIRIDLADPVAHAGPPPMYLLGPAAAVLVALPLALSAGLYRGWSEAVERAAASARQIATLDEQAAASAAERRQVEHLQSILDGAARLRAHSAAMLSLVPAVTRHLQPDTHLAELAIDAASVRVVGNATSASDVSLWLGRSAGRDPALVWAAPEIRHAAAEGRVEFALRIGRAAPTREVVGP